jgi:CheY-like chemotaxis protein
MSKTSFESVPLAELHAKGLKQDTTPAPPLVLVVDDERTIADTLVVILKQAGLAAVAAYSGESALEMALFVPPNLLLSDVAMPGMNGIELAIAVKKAIPDCQVLLFSGQASAVGLLEGAKKNGLECELLAKPVHPTDLLAQVFANVNGVADTDDVVGPGPASSGELIVPTA